MHTLAAERSAQAAVLLPDNFGAISSEEVSAYHASERRRPLSTESLYPVNSFAASRNTLVC